MSTADRDQPAQAPLTAAVLTISDSRTVETDTSGRTAVELLTGAGYAVAERTLVTDDAAAIRAVVLNWAREQRVDLILTTGGTGLSPRDTTYEALAPLFDKAIPGFGELFRILSHREIGPAAMLSRASAGTIGRVVVFLLPGSTAAVQLALAELILPQGGHIARELARQR